MLVYNGFMIILLGGTCHNCSNPDVRGPVFGGWTGQTLRNIDLQGDCSKYTTQFESVVKAQRHCRFLAQPGNIFYSYSIPRATVSMTC
jgi:hypothetical protein